MGKIFKTAEELQQEAFFHIPFWQAPPSDIFAERTIRFDELAAEDSSDWSAYLLLAGQISSAQQTVLNGLQDTLFDVGAASGETGAARLPSDFVERNWQHIQPLFAQLHGELNAKLTSTAQTVWQELQAWDDADLRALAVRIARHQTAAGDHDYAVWVSAVLQTAYTRAASQLPESDFHSSDERLFCPCCGDDAVGSIVIANGELENLRYLHCPTCNSRWNALRAKCTFCGNTKDMSLQNIEAAPEGSALSGAYGECCPECHGYRKLYRQAKQRYTDPVADDLATLALDMLLAENGWQRGGSNPFLLTGN